MMIGSEPLARTHRQQVETAFVGQHQVEQQNVDAAGRARQRARQHAPQRGSAGDRCDAHAIVLEVVGHQRAQFGVVVDQQGVDHQRE